MDSVSSPNSGSLVTYQPPTDAALAAPLPPPPPVHPTLPNKSTEPSLLDYWHVLVRRKWTIFAFLLVTLTVVIVVSLRMPPRYEAAGRIAVYKETQDSLGMKGGNAGSADTSEVEGSVLLETQVQILKSRMLATDVARRLLKPTNSPVTANRSVGTILTANSQDESAMIGRLMGGLQITIVPRTQIIEIRYSDHDPKFTAEVVKSYTEMYIENNFRAKLQSMGQTTEWLTQQLNDLQLKVEISEEKLVKYQREHGILGGDDKTNVITSRLEDLNKQLTAAEAERINKQVNFQNAAAGDSEAMSKMEGGTVLQRLRLQENELRDKLKVYSLQYGPSYPKVVETKSQLEMVQTNIAAEERRVLDRLRTDFNVASQREKMLRDSFDRQKGDANQLNESSIQFSLLKRDVDSNRQLFENLQQRLKEAGVVAGLKSSNVNIIDAPIVPRFPSEPNIPRNLLLGLMIGLFGGVGLALLFELMDNTVVTPEDVQHLTQMPLLGVIPNSRPARPALSNGVTQKRLPAIRPLISQAKPNSQISESFRALRTSLLLSSTSPKIIVVTSALPQEGKTTTCVNVATTLAQKGSRVLLVDADMRRPSVHKTVGCVAGGGLSTVLTGMDRMEDVVAHVESFPNVSFLFAGPVPPQPAELLDSEHMRRCLAEWSKEYDHVVLDTPPVLTVTDAVLLSTMADCVVMVIRSGVTKKDAVKRARDLLSQVRAKMTGVVLNAVDTNSPNYYYYNAKYYGAYYDEEH